jgi:hypothetical protein
MELYTCVVVLQVKKSAADDLRVCSESSPNIAFERDAANSAAPLNLDVRVRPLTAQEIVLYKEPYVDDGMRTMRRASVGGTGWGAKPAKKRAAVAQPRAADRTSPAT